MQRSSNDVHFPPTAGLNRISDRQRTGRVLGRAIEELITTVSSSTFYRWLREEQGTANRKQNPKGGQQEPREIRKRVIRIRKATGFGYTRIIGELRKLGIKKNCRQTVQNILKQEGFQPGAK